MFCLKDSGHKFHISIDCKIILIPLPVPHIACGIEFNVGIHNYTIRFVQIMNLVLQMTFLLVFAIKGHEPYVPFVVYISELV